LRDAKRPGAHLAAALLTSLGLSGCAAFWDDVTSRNFEFKNLYSSPNPLLVLRDSTDGDERAKALRMLREPKQHSGSDADQDAVVNILVTAAKSDPQPYCRLAAIQSLGFFHDPRAAQGLSDAFFAVTVGEPHKQAPLRTEAFAANTAFPPDTANIIQCEALTALGHTKNPAAVDLLARVARPGPSTVVEASEQDKQANRDLRIAAVRALGNFSHYQATEALVVVLEKDKDVALHNRALESLQASTGQKLADDPKAWQDLLHQTPTEQNAAAPAKEKKFDLVGWFKGE
jgi:HEAT repeat protein